MQRSLFCGGVLLAITLAVISEAEGGIQLWQPPHNTISGDHVNAKFGSSVSAGDFNGDGYDDLVANAGTSKSFLYYGSPFGIHTRDNWTTASATALGDLNGDGYDDVAVYGESLFSEPWPCNDTWIHIHYGSATGLSVESSQTLLLDCSQKVTRVGDLNGDGFDDMAANGTNRVSVYYSSAAGLPAVPNNQIFHSSAILTYSESAAAGDVNNDGFDDLMFWNPGKVYVHYGSATGVANLENWSATGTGLTFGTGMGSAGDFNNDGYDDIIIGDPGHTESLPTRRGKLFVYAGGQSGLSTSADWTYEGPSTDIGLGHVATSAGVASHGNGTSVIVGASSYSDGENSEGAYFLYYLGGDSMLAGGGPLAGDQENANLGTVTPATGDFNGDGAGDIVLGGPDVDGEFSDQGMIYIYYSNVDSHVGEWSLY